MTPFFIALVLLGTMHPSDADAGAATDGQLWLRPRADMPGFQPCAIDEQRQRQYVAREEVEVANRAALRDGQKQYDVHPQ